MKKNEVKKGGKLLALLEDISFLKLAIHTWKHQIAAVKKTKKLTDEQKKLMIDGIKLTKKDLIAVSVLRDEEEKKD